MSNIDTNKVFNRAKTMDEYQNTPIFCGADVGLIDSINKPFPKLFSLYKELKSLDWSEDEFDYEKQCPIDFKSCHPDVKAMMIETLAWQWEADSVASNTPYDILSPFISSTEFAICIKRIMDNECLHGLTYSEIVRMSFDNPREVMDDILNFQNTNQRMELVEHTLGEAYDLSCKYRSGLIEMSDDLYRDVCLKTIICMLVLERIQFMASFAITFTICSTGLFQAIGKAVQKICQDELEIHCQFDKQVLLYEMETEKGRKAITELKDWIVSIIRDAIDSEFAFVDSLFRDGRSLTGTNPELVKQWVLFNTRDVVNFFGLKDEFTDIKFPSKNPMPILDNWIDIGKTQSAPQEQQIAQYKLNAVDFSKTDDVKFDLGDLDF